MKATTLTEAQADSATMQALDESIEHWERMVTGNQRPDETPTADECALCRKFSLDFTDEADACNGCPIKLKTGHSWCAGSPYFNAYEEFDSCGMTSEFRRLAKLELEFLTGLRP